MTTPGRVAGHSLKHTTCRFAFIRECVAGQSTCLELPPSSIVDLIHIIGKVRVFHREQHD